jgi:hypothetical protein
MSQTSLIRLIVFGVACLVVTTSPELASAQVEPGPIVGTLHVINPDQCASEEVFAALAEELAIHMPDVDVEQARDLVEARWRLSLERDGAGRCWAHFSGNRSPSVMRLGAETSSEDVQTIASRVAWLASVEEASIDDRATALIDQEPNPEQDVEPDVEPVVEQVLEPEPSPSPLEVVSAPPPFRPETTVVPVKLSFLPDIFYPEIDASFVVPALSFNIIAGRSYGLQGLEVGLLLNEQEAFAQGFQFTLGVNQVGGDVDGFQFASIANVNAGDLRGASISSLYNHAGGEAHGAQVSGGVNVAFEGVRGAQVAAFANVAGPGRGAQVSPFNVTASWRGAQIGAVNLARDVDGLQLGLLNVGRDTTVSVGIINFSRENLLSLGLLNVHYGEPAHIQFWHAIGGMSVLAIRHGGRYLQYTYGLGYGLSAQSPDVVALGFGIGTRFAFERLYMELDLLGFDLRPTSSFSLLGGQAILNQLRVTLGWMIFRRFAVFSSGALSMLAPWSQNVDAVIPPWAGRYLGEEGGREIWLWPELQFGLRF